MAVTLIQYIDRLKRWEWTPWLTLAIRLGVVNFLILSLGFYAGVATPARGFLPTVLSALYVVSIIAWVFSLGGMFTARLKGRIVRKERKPLNL